MEVGSKRGGTRFLTVLAKSGCSSRGGNVPDSSVVTHGSLFGYLSGASEEARGCGGAVSWEVRGPLGWPWAEQMDGWTQQTRFLWPS